MNKDKLVGSSAELKGDESFGFKGSPGFILRRVVDPEGGGSTQWGSTHFRMSLVTVEPMAGSARHVHYNCDEAWYIVGGEGIFYADGRKAIFKSGDFLFIHKNVVHQLINTGKIVLTYVAVTAPPCNFKTDVHVVEEFDQQRHATPTSEKPIKMKPIEFPSLLWIERLQQVVNTDAEFTRAAEWFDGSILLIIGTKEYWIKISMGQVIFVKEGRLPFGATFAIRGEEATWRKLLTARKNIFRELLFKGELVMDGNLIEGMRVSKTVNLLLDAGRRLCI